MDSGEIVAVAEGSTMKADAMTKALDELDSLRDKTAPWRLGAKSMGGAGQKKKRKAIDIHIDPRC